MDGKPTVELRLEGGIAVKSPAKVLKGLGSKLSFDPVQFCSADPRGQRDLLLALCGATIDSAWIRGALQAETGELVEEAGTNAAAIWGALDPVFGSIEGHVSEVLANAYRGAGRST